MIRIAQDFKDFAKWPTFPQLWVNGQLFGGIDILQELHNGDDGAEGDGAGDEEAGGELEAHVGCTRAPHAAPLYRPLPNSARILDRARRRARRRAKQQDGTLCAPNKQPLHRTWNLLRSREARRRSGGIIVGS